MASTLGLSQPKSPPTKPPPANRKKAATPDLTSFPAVIWARKLNYKAIGGASLPQTKQQSSQILKLLNLDH